MDFPLWGEIEEKNNADWDIIPKETVKRLMLESIITEAPKAHQSITAESSNQLITLGPEHSTMEENVLYTIQLLKHSRLLGDAINHIGSKDEAKSSEGKDVNLLVLPKAPDNIKKFKPVFPRLYQINDDSPFAVGAPISVPNLGKEVVKEVLFKTVSTICAHAGFDCAMRSSLQVLTDIAESFLTKFMKLLRLGMDREALYGESGFPDQMERVFHEMGLGSMVCLHDFYQLRILQHRDRCEADCRALLEQYQASLPAVNLPQEDYIRIKSEPDSEEDIPELHVPAMDDKECENHQDLLESGLQMLHSIEQEEEQMQSSMETDDEVVNDSQSVESSSQGSEAWTNLPKTKKQRRN